MMSQLTVYMHHQASWDNLQHLLVRYDGLYSETIFYFNRLRLRQNGRRFVDHTFKPIFLNENVRISINISLKFVPKGPINNNPALFQIMALPQSGDKPLSEPMMVSLLMHICVTRPQWVMKIYYQCHSTFFASFNIFKEETEHIINPISIYSL